MTMLKHSIASSSYAESGALSHKNTESVKKAVSDGNIQPLKFRSPPPKPPRRRNSDQHLISTTGTYPTSRKKSDGNLSMTEDLHSKISSRPTNSGCGSLPSNWTANCDILDNQGFARLCLPIRNLNNKLEFEKNSLNDSILIKSASTAADKNVIASLENSDAIFIPQILKPDCSKPHPVLSDHFKMNGVEIPSNLYQDSILTLESKKQLLDFNKDFHRRYNSDSMLSYFDQPFKKDSFMRSSSHCNQLLHDSFNCNKSNLSLENCVKMKEVACLYEEIKALKGINDKLWSHLCILRGCLENGKKSSDDLTISSIEIFSDLYHAHKAKECAMEKRLKIVLEDRDTAVSELEQMVQALTRTFEDVDLVYEENSDKRVKEILKDIETTENVTKLLSHQRLLLAYLYRSKESKQHHLSHELELATAERDNAIAKAKRLEDELRNLKFSNDLWHSDIKHWEQSLLVTLCRVIEQQNISKSSMFHGRKHIGYWLSQAQKLSGQCLNSDYESTPKHEDSNFTVKLFQSPTVDINKYSDCSLDPQVNEIKWLKEQIKIFRKAYEEEVKSRENAEKKCQRLERILNVLHRKVNGEHVGIPV